MYPYVYLISVSLWIVRGCIQSPPVDHVYILSSPVSIPNVIAYTVSLSDVRGDVSEAGITFDLPGTGHPIVIYGVKRFHLPECYASMRVDTYSGDTIDCEAAEILRNRVWPALDSFWLGLETADG